jgi:hypothetical protein
MRTTRARITALETFRSGFRPTWSGRSGRRSNRRNEAMKATGGNMKNHLLLVILASLLCVSCAAYIGPSGVGVAIGPPLPYAVASPAPHYAYGGQPYYSNPYYSNYDRGYYAQPGSGYRRDLPGDQYPNEVRYRAYRY